MLKIQKNHILKIFKYTLSYAKLLVLLGFLWAIFSGTNDPFLITCGVVSSIITFIVCVHFKIISPDSYIIRLGFIKYVYELIRNIITSTIELVKIIYSEQSSINPGTIVANVSNLTNQEKVLFSNIITMTPGTFVIAVNGDEFLIHALKRDSALEFLKNKDKIRKLLKMSK